MMHRIDLDAYCRRIGYDGPRTPTLATLAAMQELHVAAIPFEAIDVLLGKRIDLDPAAVEAKLIHGRRGGYCFEHNGLFKRVLEAIGFQVTGHLGRVYWANAAPAAVPGRTHMAISVAIDGEHWLADVGFGAYVPTAPLRLRDPAPQTLRHDTLRVRPTDEGWALEVMVDQAWAVAYDLSRQPQHDSDYAVANWFTSTHPDSHFAHDLVLARTAPEVKYTLLRNRLTIRPVAGAAQRTELTAPELHQALRDLFRLVPQPEWASLIEATAAGKAWP